MTRAQIILATLQRNNAYDTTLFDEGITNLNINQLELVEQEMNLLMNDEGFSQSFKATLNILKNKVREVINQLEDIKAKARQPKEEVVMVSKDFLKGIVELLRDIQQETFTLEKSEEVSISSSSMRYSENITIDIEKEVEWEDASSHNDDLDNIKARIEVMLEEKEDEEDEE